MSLLAGRSSANFGGSRSTNVLGGRRSAI
ncbi:hypothetical protein QN277_020219 [Acacia crassicarpa]|uniref:Uncharacterized protein n=1 Tax=Acacia crassicarpa TaxID=499986 RepID=A0AAE1KEJ7_9FABA|nr:hypothetical protein QN277_020219 [Acacia crassicarpa]